MDEMASTNAKRPNTEMLFSEESQPLPDKNYLRDLFSDILDEKFKEHLNPVKQQIERLKVEMDTMREKNETTVKELTLENKILLEFYQRKNNLRLCNIPEQTNENLDDKVVSLCNRYLDTSHKFQKDS